MYKMKNLSNRIIGKILLARIIQLKNFEYHDIIGMWLCGRNIFMRMMV